MSKRKARAKRAAATRSVQREIAKALKHGQEFDLHIWAKPEDENLVRTYTVSLGKRAVCIDFPIDRALASIREVMEGA